MRFYFQVQFEYGVQSRMNFFSHRQPSNSTIHGRGTTQCSSCRARQFFSTLKEDKLMVDVCQHSTHEQNYSCSSYYTPNLGWTFVHFCSDRLWRQKVKHVLNLKQFKEEEIVIWYHVISVNRFPQARPWYVTFRYFSLVIKALKTMRWSLYLEI